MAIIGAAAFGIVNIIDSHLLSRRMPGLQAFLLPVGIIFLIICLIMFFLYPIPAGTEMIPLLAALFAGILRTSGIIITLYTLQKEEVSKVMPITHTYPIFVAIIAIPLFGENLSYLHWMAIIVVVAGAVIVSAEKGTSGSKFSLNRTFLLLFIASLFLALADICTKYALAHITIVNGYTLSILSMAIIYIVISLRPGVIRQLSTMKQRNSSMFLLGFNELLALAAAMIQIWAIAVGPVSLVSTISSTRPVFIAIYSIILSVVMPGFLIRHISNRGMVLRFAAILLIVGGLSIIYLT
jgi:drug/metabolite transporter (DMT)-like permease